MVTEDQLIDFVLDNFRDIGTGQAAPPESVAKVRPYIAGVLADLATRNIVYIPDGSSVPDEAAHWVAALIAHAPGLRQHFGETQDIPTAEYCRTQLLRQKPARSYPPARVDYI